jgi:hypothetical protein
MKQQTPCTNFYSSSLKSSVTDFGCSFLLFSDKMPVIVALCSSYNLLSLRLQAIATLAFNRGQNVNST